MLRLGLHVSALTGLVLLIGILLMRFPVMPSPLPRVQAAPAATAASASGTEASVPVRHEVPAFETLSHMAAAPLFYVSRRPPGRSEGTSSSPVRLVPVKLIGIIHSSSDRKALVRWEGQPPLWVLENEKLKGTPYRIAKILKDRVHVEDGDRIFAVRLAAFNQPTKR